MNSAARIGHAYGRIRAGDPTTGPDGLSPAETVTAVSDKVHRLVDAQHRCFREELGPILASEGITPDQEWFTARGRSSASRKRKT